MKKKEEAIRCSKRKRRSTFVRNMEFGKEDSSIVVDAMLKSWGVRLGYEHGGKGHEAKVSRSVSRQRRRPMQMVRNIQ